MKPNLSQQFIRIGKIDGWLETQEIQFLYTIAFKAIIEIQEHEIIVEIGSWKGKSTAVLGLACKHAKKGILYAIDPCKNTTAHNYLAIPNTKKHLEKTIKSFGIESYVRIIPLTSKQAYAQFRKSISRLVFIDGDHELSSVEYDVTHWVRTIINDGYLLLHDTINHLGPRTMLFRLLRNPHFRYIGTCKDLSCFQRITRPSLLDWAKKIYAYVIFKAFFKIYIPAVS